MQTYLLVALMFGIVATRPLEARRWREGRISDRTAALLILGRFPVVIVGFALVMGLPAPGVALAVLVSLVPVVLLYGWTVARLRRARARAGGG